MAQCENFELEGYNFEASNRINKKGGGVGIYVSKETEYNIRNALAENIEDSIETIFIEISNSNGKNIIIGVIYRPPNNKLELFENAINNLLSKIGNENKICYLTGDFNIDLLKSDSCDYTSRFIEQLFTSSFIPLITKPTRVTSHTATPIDNIYTNNIENGIIYSDISDHLPIVQVCEINNYEKTLPQENTKHKRLSNDKNIKSFTNAIKNTSWEKILSNNNDPNVTFNEFSGVFMTAFESNFPTKVIKERIDKERSPWMTKCILKSVKRKNKLYELFLKNPSIKLKKDIRNTKIN